MRRHGTLGGSIMTRLLRTLPLAAGLLVLAADAAAQMRAASDFESGSARVLGLDAPTQTIHITPAGDPKRGWPCWWYVRLDNLDPAKRVSVGVTAFEGIVSSPDSADTTRKLVVS